MIAQISISEKIIQDPKNFEAMEIVHSYLNAKIYDDRLEKRLFVRWLGDQNNKSVETVSLEMVKVLEKLGYDQVLNCNQLVKCHSDQMDDWILDVWAPMMIDAGLKSFAWILSPDELIRFPAKPMTADEEDRIFFKFNTLEEGESWLDKMNRMRWFNSEGSVGFDQSIASN